MEIGGFVPKEIGSSDKGGLVDMGEKKNPLMTAVEARGGGSSRRRQEGYKRNQRERGGKEEGLSNKDKLEKLVGENIDLLISKFDRPMVVGVGPNLADKEKEVKGVADKMITLAGGDPDKLKNEGKYWTAAQSVLLNTLVDGTDIPKLRRPDVSLWVDTGHTDTDVLNKLQESRQKLAGEIGQVIGKYPEVDSNRDFRNLLIEWSQGSLPREIDVVQIRLAQKEPEMARELKINDEGLVEIRGMVKKVVEGFVGAQVSSEMVTNMWKGVKTDYNAKYNLLIANWPENIEEEMRNELMARMELKAVSNFWGIVKGAVGPTDDPYALLEEQYKNMPEISGSTYKWLTSQDGYLDKSLLGRLERVNLTGQISIMMRDLFKAVNGEDCGWNKKFGGEVETIKMWDITSETQEVICEKISNYYNVNSDSVKLAWQLMVSELDNVKASGESLHPAKKIVDFAWMRLSRYLKGLPPVGGARLMIEFRQKYKLRNLGVADDSKTKEEDWIVMYRHNPFELEGESWARVGYEMWSGGRDALENGTYLQGMKKFMEKGEWLSVQAKVKKELALGAGVCDAIDEAAKSEAKKWTLPGALGKLKGKLFLDMISLRGGAALGDGRTAKEIGGYLEEYAKSFMWLNSWANPNNKDWGNAGFNTVVPIETLKSNFKTVLMDYDWDKKQGQFFGFGYGDSMEGKQKAREMIEWFDTLLKRIDKRVDNIPDMPKAQREAVKWGKAIFNKREWLGTGLKAKLFRKGGWWS